MQLDPSAFVADSSLIAQLGIHAEPVDCTRNRVLFRQGGDSTGVFLLYEGEASITMTSESGASLLSSTAFGNSVLGLPGLIANSPYTLTVTALAGARVGFISRQRFTELLQSDSMLLLNILRILAAEVRTARMALSHL